MLQTVEYREIKLLEQAIKIVERALQKRLQDIINLDESQFGFMPGKGTVDAIFVLERMEKSFERRRKACISVFFYLEKALEL